MAYGVAYNGVSFNPVSDPVVGGAAFTLVKACSKKAGKELDGFAKMLWHVFDHGDIKNLGKEWSWTAIGDVLNGTRSIDLREDTPKVAKVALAALVFSRVFVKNLKVGLTILPKRVTVFLCGKIAGRIITAGKIIAWVKMSYSEWKGNYDTSLTAKEVQEKVDSYYSRVGQRVCYATMFIADNFVLPVPMTGDAITAISFVAAGVLGCVKLGIE
ncbi:hypothetical protein COB21_00675 [Candidatus Aerophobetes bacterium]|uniref:Uncharacterized protein n=1 Tax=Aerophobetes bacterium TaxID=2030807 RepID=A0A2A4X7T9_UNCAE|nr:MAG: hypothetical protein COB21_00675 [Candidatus Aerophobetes bacterium]